MRAVGVDADVFGHGVACFAEGLGEDGGGALFVVGEFWVFVEILVGVDEGWRSLLDEGVEILRGGWEDSNGAKGAHDGE
jgi:hypothetical protein